MGPLQPAERPAPPHPFIRKLHLHREYFHRTLECFRDEDACFRVAPGTMTTAGQVLHVAGAIEFFLSGLFGPFDGFTPMAKRPRGFNDLSWTKLSNDGTVRPASSIETWEARRSLKKAMEFFDRTMSAAIALFGARTVEALQRDILAPNPIFPPGATAADVFDILIDHTAHHRGALAQYARGLGREPKIPYFDMAEALHEEQFMSDVRPPGR